MDWMEAWNQFNEDDMDGKDWYDFESEYFGEDTEKDPDDCDDVKDDYDDCDARR